VNKMSLVTMTVKQIMDLGLWEKVCDYKGWNLWIVNEGKIDSSEEVEFDTEFKKENSKYLEALPISIKDMDLFSYNISCTPSYQGMYFGIIFAKDKQDALEKINVQYSWEDDLKITLDDITLLDYNQFENDCYEIGSHRE